MCTGGDKEFYEKRKTFNTLNAKLMIHEELLENPREHK